MWSYIVAIFPAELDGYISWILWVYADDVAKEGVPAKACTTSDVSVLDLMEPAHTEDMSLTTHVESL